jgi:hypothetical protein
VPAYLPRAEIAMSERETAPPRKDLRFDTGDGCCAAWLYRPQTGTAAPVVMVGQRHCGTYEAVPTSTPLASSLWGTRHVSTGI